MLNHLHYLGEKTGYIKRRFFKPRQPINADGKVYVNLGCGANTSSEFLNVDARPMPHIHFVNAVEDLSMFKNDSVDLLYASHVLEHVPRKDLLRTLREWYRVLKPGGILRFGVPNFDELINVYLSSGSNTESIVNQLMGQDPPYDDHHTIWNFHYAEEVLKSAGFKKIQTWSPSSVDNHNFIDKTMRVISLNGKDYMISLNIESYK